MYSKKGNVIMEKPGLGTYLNPIQINIRYKVYCEHLNSTIRKMIREKGVNVFKRKSAGKTRCYSDNNVIFCETIYRDGTEEYSISIHSNVWNDIPDGINPYLIYEYGWNDVYCFRDGRYKEVLLLYVPGDWEQLLSRYQ